ncbi:MAG TPA: hypothetical protein VGK59_23455 [Ohtaekwangia sp.]
MEQTIKILIYIHAFCGGLGLVTGIVSVWARKGGLPHRKAGKVFSYAMGASSLISLFVSRMPGHENLFLFLIGVFTLYMVLAGNRALTFKSKVKVKADLLDYLISGTMLVISVIMIGLGLWAIIQKSEGILYIFFGGFGLLMTLNDFRMFRTFAENKDARLRSHLGRMIGALIASTTAFMIAGLNIPTLFIWIMPSILGTIYIIYWSRKLKAERSAV